MISKRILLHKVHMITMGVITTMPRGYVKRNEKKILEKPMLYNLNDDPSEKFNIANQYPEVIEKRRKNKRVNR